jgi:precorrin-6A synthase
MSRRVLVIGIGSGDPDHLTLGAVRALNEADAVFLVDKGDADEALRRAREAVCARVVEPGHEYRLVRATVPAVRDRPGRDQGDGGYVPGVSAWRAERVEVHEELISGLAAGETGAFLAWGDPTLFDGTIAVLDEVAARGHVAFDLEVVPGISSVAALAARHRVALQRVGEPVLVTTGRRLGRDGWPPGVANLVVLLDADDALSQLDDDAEIWWGGLLGLPGERLIHGRVGDCRDEIRRARADARRDEGWVFDTYLVRRP